MVEKINEEKKLPEFKNLHRAVTEDYNFFLGNTLNNQNDEIIIILQEKAGVNERVYYHNIYNIDDFSKVKDMIIYKDMNLTLHILENIIESNLIEYIKENNHIRVNIKDKCTLELYKNNLKYEEFNEILNDTLFNEYFTKYKKLKQMFVFIYLLIIIVGILIIIIPLRYYLTFNADNALLQKELEELDSVSNYMINVGDVKVREIYNFNNIIDSDIIFKKSEIEFLKEILKGFFKTNNITYKFKLKYRASLDGDTSFDFYQKCSDIKSNIALIKTTKGRVFGLITNENWGNITEDGTKEYEKYVDKLNYFTVSFSSVFNYTDNDNDYKKIITNKDFILETYCGFKILNKALNNGGLFSNCKTEYQNNLIDLLNNGEKSFEIEEIEVFEVN